MHSSFFYLLVLSGASQVDFTENYIVLKLVIKLYYIEYYSIFIDDSVYLIPDPALAKDLGQVLMPNQFKFYFYILVPMNLHL